MYRGNPKSKKMIVLLLVLTFLLVPILTGCTSENADPSRSPESTPAATISTSPEETEEPVIIETFPELDAPEPFSICYAEYLELSPEMQQAYYENFETPEDFYDWFDSAKAEYENSTDPAESMSTESGDNIFVADEAVEDWD